jgi:hypothetical protein
MNGGIESGGKNKLWSTVPAREDAGPTGNASIRPAGKGHSRSATSSPTPVDPGREAVGRQDQRHPAVDLLHHLVRHHRQQGTGQQPRPRRRPPRLPQPGESEQAPAREAEVPWPLATASPVCMPNQHDPWFPQAQAVYRVTPA